MTVYQMCKTTVYQITHLGRVSSAHIWPPGLTNLYEEMNPTIFLGYIRRNGISGSCGNCVQIFQDL